VRIPNDPDSGPGGAFGELLRLQTEFQARLAEETVKYLRRLQGAGMPAAPGTVVRPDAGVELRADGAPGGTATLSLEISNLQRVHCIVTPMLEPLVEASGVTWFPELEPAAGSTLVAPGESRPLALQLRVPVDLPRGTYRGALVLQGFRDGALPVTVAVEPPAPPARKARTRKAPAKKPRQATRRRTS
jgi:hypothetical protein